MKSGDKVVAQVKVNPGVRLLFDDDNSYSIQTNPESDKFVHEVSDFRPFLEQISDKRIGKHWRGTRLLIYRNRGIGDQLIASSLSRIFRELLRADPFQLSDPAHESLWAFNPHINGSPLSMPLPLDAVWRSRGPAFFQSEFFFESVTEWETDSEQPNVYDRLLAMCGLDPGRIPEKFKRPVFYLKPEEIAGRAQWIKDLGEEEKMEFSKGYFVLQFRTTNKVRSFPLSVIEKVLGAANERGLPILCTDNEPFAPEVLELIQKTTRAIDVSTKLNNVRHFAAVISGASLVIGPDSSAIHFAAAFDTPAVGIWSSFSPESRVSTYHRQIHIHHAELCNSAPCYNFMPDLPVNKCPNGSEQKHCECYDGVTTEEISYAIGELLK